jgi:hypothetical protein
LYAKHSIPYIAVIFYGDCMKVCEDFTMNFGEFGIFLPKKSLIPHPPYSPDLALCDFSVSSIEDKTERLPF